MTSQSLSARPTGRPSRAVEWPLPAALVALSAVPLAAGTLRLVQLAGGPAVMPADDRFGAFPVALVVHILGAAVYALLGTLQFVPRFRRRHLSWHRRSGRVLAVAAAAVAGSALWMTLVYAPQPGTGDLLVALRLVFASAMAGPSRSDPRSLSTSSSRSLKGSTRVPAAGAAAFGEPSSRAGSGRASRRLTNSEPGRRSATSRRSGVSTGPASTKNRSHPSTSPRTTA